MDKNNPRWKNVPTPMRNAQISLLGTCFLITPEKNLCVNLDSINLPSTTANFVSSVTPAKDATVGNRRKFAARAPIRGVVTSTATSNGTITANHVASLYVIFLMVFFASYLATCMEFVGTRLLHQPVLKQFQRTQRKHRTSRESLQL